MATAADFFSWMFETALGQDDELHISIWSPNNKARFFRKINDAANNAIVVDKQKADTYFGVCLCRTIPTTGRGKEQHMGAMTAIWADFDVGGDSKKNLPDSVDEIRTKLYPEIGIRPSIEISSGHGLHCYWLLVEPFIFKTISGRRQAKEFSRQWQATIKQRCIKLKWHYDNVGDLARVLRVPDTHNWKAEPLPVEILMPTNGNPAYYTLDDIQAVMIESNAIEQAIEHVNVTAKKGGKPPLNKFALLLENVPEAKLSWQRQRKDLRDQSNSGYDLSLAAHAVQAGWTDQEICDLLIAFAEEHHEPVKKSAYYARTIGTARSKHESDQAVDHIVQMVDTGVEKPDTDKKRKNLLAQISKALGVTITRWMQTGRENAIYRAALGNGRMVRIGGTNDLMEPSRFRRRIYEETGVAIRPIKTARWLKICESLALAAELVEPDSGRMDSMVTEWLREYFSDRQIAVGDEWQMAAAIGQPFERDGCLYVYLPNFDQYLRVKVGVRAAQVDLYEVMRALGWRRKTVAITSGEKPTSKSCWCIEQAAYRRLLNP